jgi:hypothetical protein
LAKAKTDPQNLQNANDIIMLFASTIVSSDETFMQLSGNFKTVDCVNLLGEYKRYSKCHTEKYSPIQSHIWLGLHLINNAPNPKIGLAMPLFAL